ncbi:MAG: right-handed parallel beta-helix repeat-containing protein [Phycisphaeraceae bacterium]|nr:right-handed parallel beta-helix repeat-containing protein [Phycisphaeraceae bacterium]
MATLCLLLFIAPGPAAHAIDLYIAPYGSADNPGTQEKPLATLEQARDKLRLMREKAADEEPHTVYLFGGRYHFDRALHLDARDGGSEASPVTYRAMPGQRVVLHGGTAVPADLFRKPNADERARLQPKAQGRVRVAEVSDQIAKAFPAGNGRYGILTQGQYTLQHARWPNRGFAHIKEVFDLGPTTRWLKSGERLPRATMGKPTGGRFTLSESTDFVAWQRELARTQDVYQNGYISIDWQRDNNRVARVTEGGEVQLIGPTLYGIGGVRYPHGFADPDVKPHRKPHRRLFFSNLLCELDMPGEWYFDRQAKTLYLWPIAGKDSRSPLSIIGSQELISVKDASHIRFENLVLENTGKAIRIQGGSHNHVAGCTIRNTSSVAVWIDGGSHHRIDGCDIYNTPTAFIVRGGDTQALTRSHHEVVNCHFHHIRGQGYSGGRLQGCGIAFRNNVYHTTNNAIVYGGAYIDIAYNEFYNIGWEMGDWNVLYCGAKKWFNGNVVEHNFFHHMMHEPGRHAIAAVRVDDGGSGTTYRSNIFYKTGVGATTYFGPNNHTYHNIVLDTPLMWWTTQMPTTDHAIRAMYDEIAEQYHSGRYPRGQKDDVIYNVETVVGQRGWDKPLWRDAFPDFPKYMNENPFAQSYSSVLNNYHNFADPDDPEALFTVGRNSRLPKQDFIQNPTMASLPGTFRWNTPLPIKLTDFRNPKRLDFRLKPGFKLIDGFVPCDLEKVGLFKSEFRKKVTNPAVYRSEIYKRYQSTPSTGGRYDYTTAYERYPIQPWIE